MGRWAALVIAAMWAYFLAVVAAQKQPRLHLARPAVVALAACYLLGPLTVSGTLAVPHMMHYLLRLPPQTAVWPICHPRFPDIMLAP
jgi:hypothetical protein